MMPFSSVIRREVNSIVFVFCRWLLPDTFLSLAAASPVHSWRSSCVDTQKRSSKPSSIVSKGEVGRINGEPARWKKGRIDEWAVLSFSLLQVIMVWTPCGKPQQSLLSSTCTSLNSPSCALWSMRRTCSQTPTSWLRPHFLSKASAQVGTHSCFRAQRARAALVVLLILMSYCPCKSVILLYIAFS